MIREPRSVFVGRHRELALLQGLLEVSQLVTLTGVGGAGKTRLALRAANLYAETSGIDGWFVSLESVQDSQRLPRAVVRALGLADQSARDPLDVVVEALRDRPTVLIIDNCEHIIDAAASFIDELLLALPDLTVLATSRRPLELDGERVFAVPPLSAEPIVGPTHDELPDAVSLLVARARAADAAFELGPHDAEAAAELCRALDGLPLAIELAATRLRTLSITDLTSRLSSRFTLLRGGSRSAVSRQRTLRAVVDWSYELCTPEQRELWSALSVFSGPFDLAAASAVAEGRDVLDSLDELVAQSVVEADPETGRFRMLETIRRYGRDRAEEDGRWPGLTRRHLDHYAAVAAESCDNWYGPGQAETLARLRADRAELQSALTTASAIDTDGALDLFTNLRYHWAVGGFIPEGRAWAARLLALPKPSPVHRVPALVNAAWLALLQGDLAEAAGRLDEAEEQATESSLTPERLGTFRVELHRWRGTLANFAGRPTDAVREFEVSIRAAQEGGHPEEALLAQFQLTAALSHLRESGAARTASEALAYTETVDDNWMRAHAQWAIALAAFVDDDLDAAERHARQGMVDERGFDDPVGECLMLEVICWVEAERGAAERAAILLGATDARWRSIGSAISAFGPHLGAHHDRCVATLQRLLGGKGYERFFARGGHLGPLEAVSLALEDKPSDAGGLSAREHEVAMRIHRGMSNRDIAEELVLSVRTVDTHVQRILGKLGFASRAQIAAWYEATLSTEPIT
ncbi:LuxR C-terminal-related transcriptional regulator [Pseudolysinimonas sp.]|uniref:ATP-binding protein n=1 Tax=Pseudolysinimonas sp. TaxID=2680009 RepID=UPI00286BB63B|nr:LuxR C-terminal-related transcriptional regulator [Pseudolysinimonas sp.]